MTRAEQVERVLNATVTYVRLDGTTHTYPLIEPGELWLPTEEAVTALVRRIITAAEGTSTSFTNLEKPRPKPVYHARRKRNIEANLAYRNRRKATV